MTNPMEEASKLVGRGRRTSDEQAEALLDYADPASVGGDSDWLVAVSVYALDADLTVDGVTVPAGTYVREVKGQRVLCWRVDRIDAAIAYAEEVEAAYRAEPPQPCEECGAPAGQKCRESNCQGSWV